MNNTKSTKNLIIGFGKAGKTLAGFLSNRGEDVILVERNPKMYGGTCINVGCIPSKFLSTRAIERRHSKSDAPSYYAEAVTAKKNLIAKLNDVNYHKSADLPHTEVMDGEASFLDEHTVAVKHGEEVTEIRAERIFINTGMTPFLPKIEGAKLSDRVLTSETIMDLPELPESLVIIGGGYIGLEFGTTYRLFGTEVNIIGDAPEFMPNDDGDIADLVRREMTEQGIGITTGASVKKIEEDGEGVTVFYEREGRNEEIRSSHVLIATGRKAATEGLCLEKAGVETGKRGEITVNEKLETSKPHIYALGDVHGGLQFTYLSLDDFRIIKSVLTDGGTYNLSERKRIPFTVFLHPPLAKVGLNEKEAKEKGIAYKVAKLPVTAIPKAKILENQTGLFKVLVNEETGEILGANLYGMEAHELINIFTLAMNAHLSYTTLRDQIYTHPTMAEAINDLLGGI